METTAQDSTNNTETVTKQIAWWKCGTWVDDVEGAQLCDDMEPPMFGNNKHQVIEVPATADETEIQKLVDAARA